MATSNSVNFSRTRNEIIHEALQLIGVYGIGRTVSAEDMTFANSMLNKMVKAWQTKALHLWAMEEGVLVLTDNTAKYSLGNASSDAYATLESDFVLTELNGAHAASATTLTVDSTTGMTASDTIGVVNDDDSITWTTIVSVDSATALTITAGLDGACADNSNVYTFTSRITKPLRIHSVRRVSGIDSGATTTQSEIPMTQLSRQEYFELPSKTINGMPTHYYYNPDLTSGSLYLWPRPDDPEVYLKFTFSRPLEDLDASSDTFDFPSEWLEVLTFQLALRLALAFGKDDKIPVLAPIASVMLEDMLAWDNEIASVLFQPDLEH